LLSVRTITALLPLSSSFLFLFSRLFVFYVHT
jgi:hypothetical protein